MNEVARFRAKVDRTAKHGCWEWTGCVFKGYGHFKVGGKYGRAVPAHRFAYELAHGPIPRGKVVMHRCDNGKCVRLDHLRLGTQLQNVADRQAKGRTAIGEQNGKARLTFDQVSRIKQELRLGRHPKAIARPLGVYPSTIYAIRKGITWRHVT